MDKKALAVGILIGFIIGTVLTGLVIEHYVVEIVSHIPPGLVQNMNLTISMNETRLVEEMTKELNNSGVLDRMKQDAIKRKATQGND